MSNNAGGPAFPGPYMNDKGGFEIIAKQQGMTLRDYFAAMAMQAIAPEYVYGGADVLADRAYVMADAMLKARDK